jgi:hypothetical protein
VEGSCEHGNEPSGSIKCWVILEWLHNWLLLKKSSAAVSDVFPSGFRRLCHKNLTGRAGLSYNLVLNIKVTFH